MTQTEPVNLFTTALPPWISALPRDVLVIETAVELDGFAANYDQTAIDALIKTAHRLIDASDGLFTKTIFVPPAWGDGSTWLLVGEPNRAALSSGTASAPHFTVHAG